MDPDNSQIEETNDSRVGETPLGGREFRGSVSHPDPLAPKQTPAPEGIPEKFWDPLKGELRTDDLIKSYANLEKMVGQKKDPDPSDDDEPKDDEPKGDDEPKDDDAPKGDEPKDDEPKDEPKDDETSEEDAPAPLVAALDAAQAVYSEKGELPEEARKPLLEQGITNEQIDFYLAGIKATEAALEQAYAKGAGSKEALQKAIEWAGTKESGWTDKQRIAMNAQLGSVETAATAAKVLMEAYREANPGEGRLQNINSGVNRGDLYESLEEFRQDLKVADDLRDGVKRRKALDKLRRSRAAGVIKSNRRQPFGG